MQQSKQYTVNLPLKQVQESLTNLVRFGELHPLITKVIPIKNTIYKHPKYQISEYPYTWLPIPIKYYATLIPQENGIHYDIEGLPLMKVNLVYQWSSNQANSTIIEVTITINGLIGARNILMYKMFAAQDNLMQKMGQ